MTNIRGKGASRGRGAASSDLPAEWEKKVASPATRRDKVMAKVQNRLRKLAARELAHDDSLLQTRHGTEKDIKDYMEPLYHKRGSVREESLTAIIKEFRSYVLVKFAEKNVATLTHRCENSINRGSPLEIDLACQAIGLLALTVGPGDGAEEIYRESLRIIPRALKSKSQPLALLECLAIATFVGGNNFEDTERSMKIIWGYITQKSENNDLSAPVIAAAISSWIFLLTTIEHYRLDYSCWKGVIPYLLELLEAEAKAEDDSLYLVVMEALALVFERAGGSVDKFSSHPEDEYLVDLNRNASKSFEDNMMHQTFTVRGNILPFSTIFQLKKMSYLERFLGDGFQNHVVDNGFLRDLFKYEPKQIVGPTLYIPEVQEVHVQIFEAYIQKDTSFQRRKMSPNSLTDKAKTQIMKKYRRETQEMKTGHFSVHDEIDVAA